MIHDTGDSRQQNDFDDVQAVHETARGNSHAFERIVDRYTPLLYSLAVRYVGRGEEAEDAVQEIFLRTYKALDRFAPGKRFYPWLYTIALNYLRNIGRKRRRRGMDNVLPYEDRVSSGDVGTPLADPTRELERESQMELVHAAIARLSPKYRDVLVLRQLEELPVADVSEILDIPEGTVKTNLHRARRAFAEELSKIDVQ